MTTAATTPEESGARTASAIIVGADAVLAAHPATAVQLAHACLAAGFSTVIPPSWGDELLATATVRLLQEREPRPTVYCACPHVSARLLGVGDDLAPFLLPFVPPPVAAALHVRELARGEPLHIAFVGACPGGDDPAIDVQYTPTDFLAMLAARGIRLAEQPEVFDSVLPPDRRRHRSLPGGVPSAEALWSEAEHRGLIEITDAEPMTELAQHLASGEPVLLDLGPALGCTCSGAVRDVPARSARSAVSALEPPRSPGEVVEHPTLVQLARPLRSSAAPYTSIERPVSVRRQHAAEAAEVGAADASPAVAMTAPTATTHPPDTSVTDASRTSVGEIASAGESGPGTAARKKTPGGGIRAVGSAVPTAQAGAGRPLPRAYVARRSIRRRSGAPESPARSAETGSETGTVDRGSAESNPPTPPPQSPTASSEAGEQSPHGTRKPPRNGSSPGRLFASVPIAAPRTRATAVPAREPDAGESSSEIDRELPSAPVPVQGAASGQPQSTMAPRDDAAPAPPPSSARASGSESSAETAMPPTRGAAAEARMPEAAEAPVPAIERAASRDPAPGLPTVPVMALRESARRFARRATDRPEYLGVLVLIVAVLGLVLGVAAARALGGGASVTADPAEHGARPDSLVGTSAPALIEERNAEANARAPDPPSASPVREASSTPPRRTSEPVMRGTASGSLAQRRPDEAPPATPQERADTSTRRGDSAAGVIVDESRRDSTVPRDSAAGGDSTVARDSMARTDSLPRDSAGQRTPGDSVGPPRAATPADSLLVRERERLQRELSERQRRIDSLQRWLDSVRRTPPPSSPAALVPAAG